ncbi:MAG: SCP2 sterol-binding domain-containing protein [Actinomycetota bacterium]|nr:SCP2 sterol-binding domain-containing protein [Ilumatobacteraceae bacterium]MDA2972940.1 SCP2 sterol-binding domain-containing protein [Actinomycetota bacterium]MDA3006408.1 SCP2 sterol-binding domain-containing protein [Actinomycetota bacterium]MDA3034829.1 SCP2 sterol-binding domain-containing protein [Actinomycetota bacterium]
MSHDTSSPMPTDSDRVRYLSLAWIREMAAAVSADDTLSALAEVQSIGVTQKVTDTPDGDVVYHLQVGAGEVTFGAGAADPEDVSMEQSYDTAVAVATGELNAQEAFITGQILLFGDRERLMGAQDVFAALDGVFRQVRERTDYT